MEKPNYKYLSKPLFKETISAIKDIYKMNCVGGALHIVLDDGNIEDEHIQWCLLNSIEEIENQNEKELYKLCAFNLLEMTERQRQNVITAAEQN